MKYTNTQAMIVKQNNLPLYDIVFASDFSDLIDSCTCLELADRKVMIVSDSHVAKHYLDEVSSLFEGACAHVSTFVFPAGEAQKNLDTVKELYTHLIEEHFERRDIMVALGGGVVGDLTGYTAATYLRGIDFIQIPTSLLAQVDSSIGGKTGVDFDSYKNMVGAFHQPKLVYINTATLSTLNRREFLSGMGEVVKYGIIHDAPFFTWLQRHMNEILVLEPTVIKQMIYQSCDNKRVIVEEDPKEKGVRALLNFGHTLGHAIEKLTDFRYLHGECVGVGSILAARIACNMGEITEGERDSIEQMIRAFECPMIRDYDVEKVIETMKSDKKMCAGKIKFILIDQIGHAFITRQVTDQDMRIVLEEYKNESDAE